jgi:large subunit ribosomal protein L9
MQIILLEEVPNLGSLGDNVTVKPGYARNYLLPRGLAVEASDRNAAGLAHKQQMVAAKIERKRGEAETLAKKLAKTEVSISVLAGEGDRLFGSVTNRDIEHALAAAGHFIARRKISLPEPIKALGVHTVQVKIHRDVTAEVKVWVVKKDDGPTLEAPAAPAEEPAEVGGEAPEAPEEQAAAEE